MSSAKTPGRLDDYDRDIAKKIFELYDGWMRNYVLRFKGRPEIADEVMQEVYQRLCEGSSTLAMFALDGSSQDHYVMKMLVDSCFRTWQRREDKRFSRQQEYDDSFHYTGGYKGQYPDDGDFVNQALDAAIEQITNAERDLILLRYRDRCTVNEIADLLSLSSNNASKRLNRILLKIKKLMAD